MAQVLVDGVQDVAEMIVAREGEMAELAVEPGCTGAHHGVGAAELSEHKLLKKRFYWLLKLSWSWDMLLQISKGMHDSFFNPKIILRSFKILSQYM